jgi:hypothetical protein
MYGLNTFKSDGSLAYSTDDVTWNQVDFFSVSAGGSASYSYPVLSGREVLTAQILIDAPPTTRKAIAHTVTVSGTTVSASGGSENAYILVLMR